MNIYEKMAKVKKEFHAMELKKTGKNKFQGYTYFELSDFVKPIVDLMTDNKLISVIDFGDAMATLTVIDCDNPEDKITTGCPVATAEMKGCQPVQNLGAVMTYTRRYLFVNLLDIIENDIVDSVDMSKPPTPPKANPEDAERKALNKDISANFKCLTKEGQEQITKTAGKSTKVMTIKELQSLNIGITELLEKEKVEAEQKVFE